MGKKKMPIIKIQKVTDSDQKDKVKQIKITNFDEKLHAYGESEYAFTCFVVKISEFFRAEWLYLATLQMFEWGTRLS
jgi:hypothetical protein